jgi:hypothetical protein
MQRLMDWGSHLATRKVGPYLTHDSVKLEWQFFHCLAHADALESLPDCVVCEY